MCENGRGAGGEEIGCVLLKLPYVCVARLQIFLSNIALPGITKAWMDAWMFMLSPNKAEIDM